MLPDPLAPPPRKRPDGLILSEPGHHAENISSQEDPWWNFGDHRGLPNLELVKEGENVAVIYDKTGMNVHFCVQYQPIENQVGPWKSCRFIPLKQWVHEYDEMSAQMELAQSEINFLRSMYT